MGGTPGTYLILIRLRRRVRESPVAGVSLPAGWYAYAGSAMGGLEARLGRHLRTTDVRKWHVDALLGNGTVVDLQLLPGDAREAECRTADLLRRRTDARMIRGFGASDCRCPSHAARFDTFPGFSVRADRPLRSMDGFFQHFRETYRDFTQSRRDPFRTLVTCILSLRTRDPVTAEAAERLFTQLREPEDFRKADPERIAQLIRPVGMYREKGKTLVTVAARIIEHFGGDTPSEIDDLLTLPGVGRKTANLVRSFAFGLPAVCVDTHVHRIANRWGLVRTRTPDETEAELRRVLPERFHIALNPFLVQHGQQVCRPIRPRCRDCALREGCAFSDLRAEAEIRARIPEAPGHPSLRF